MLSFLCGMVFAGFLVYDVCAAYLKNPIVVVFGVEEKKIRSVPFPAITSTCSFLLLTVAPSNMKIMFHNSDAMI